MSDRLIKCEVCGSVVDEEDLFCGNCGTECPPRANVAAPAGSAEGSAPPVDGSSANTTAAASAARVSTFNFTCEGCGASMSYDARAQNLRCPFCDSVKLVAQADAKVLAPDAVVPFAVERAQAVDAMRGWLRRGFFRPGDLAIRAAVVGMQPVYVPHWVFAMRTHTFWTADAGSPPMGAQGDWYPVAGQFEGSYRDILVSASRALTPAEAAALAPFPLERGLPPAQVDLENITVEQFTAPRKYARPLVRHGVEAREAERVTSELGRSVRNVHVNVRIGDMISRPVLLPVWIMAYRYRDEVFRLLVNGQTGRVTGRTPLSWWRVALVVIVIALFALAVLAMLLARGESRGHFRLGDRLLRTPAVAQFAGPCGRMKEPRAAGGEPYSLPRCEM